VDTGWFAARTRPCQGGELLSGSAQPGVGGHGECLRRSRGDAAGV